MEALKFYKHQNQKFKLVVTLEDPMLILYLATESNVFKGVFSFDGLPFSIKKSCYTIEQAFDLFAKIQNMKVNIEEGSICLIIRSIVKNEIMQNQCVLQLDQEKEELPYQELKNEVKMLRNQLKMLKVQMDMVISQNQSLKASDIFGLKQRGELAEEIKETVLKEIYEGNNLQDNNVSRLQKKLSEVQEEAQSLRYDFESFLNNTDQFEMTTFHKSENFKRYIDQVGQETYQWKEECAAKKKDLYQNYDEHIISKNKKVILRYRGDIDEGFVMKIWPNGARYIGFTKDSQNYGMGKLETQFGDKFEGKWLNNTDMEYGFVFSKYGVMKYAGEIKNLEYHGKGMIYFNSKSYYVGEFEQGKREGRGVHYMDNGDRYIGSYSQNRRNGAGELRKESGFIKHRLYNDGTMKKQK